MDKLDYVVRQLARTKSKKYEQYVVTGIVHKLNRQDVKFVTQQYVSRDNGARRALTDLYFPAVGVHIEVDEPFHGKQVEQDELRTSDIVNATNHEILRIKIEDATLKSLDQQIDECVTFIKQKLNAIPDLKPWCPKDDYAIEPHIERGYMDAHDNIAFRRIADACNCFGYNYQSYQKGGANHPHFDNVLLWFPKLFENKGWSNTISTDETVITEYALVESERHLHFDKHINDKRNQRLVFAKAKDSLGMILYRFKGLYELDVIQSKAKNMLVWRRIMTRVPTYPADLGKLAR